MQAPSIARETRETRDWPGEKFESLWNAVGAVGGQGALTKSDVAALPLVVAPLWGQMPEGSWVLVQGRLEQNTPLGAIHPDGEEWFIRPHEGEPVAAFVAGGAALPGSQVAVVGRELGVLRLPDREGVLRDYPAVVARMLDSQATASLQSLASGAAPAGATQAGYGAIIGAVGAVIVGAWIAVRLFTRRPSGGSFARIRQVAERAR